MKITIDLDQDTVARVVAIEPVDRFIRKAVAAALTQPGPFVTPVPECD